MGQIREPDLPVQVFSQKLGHATLLPRRQTTMICLHHFERRSVPLRYVGATQKTKVIEEEYRRCLGSR